LETKPLQKRNRQRTGGRTSEAFTAQVLISDTHDFGDLCNSNTATLGSKGGRRSKGVGSLPPGQPKEAESKQEEKKDRHLYKGRKNGELAMNGNVLSKDRQTAHVNLITWCKKGIHHVDASYLQKKS